MFHNFDQIYHVQLRNGSHTSNEYVCFHDSGNTWIKLIYVWQQKRTLILHLIASAVKFTQTLSMSGQIITLVRPAKRIMCIFFFLYKNCSHINGVFLWIKCKLKKMKMDSLQQILQNHCNIGWNLLFTGRRSLPDWWSVSHWFVQQVTGIVHVLMIMCMIKWNTF